MLNFQVNYTHPWLLLLIPLAVICTLVPYFRMNKRYRRTRNRVISITMHLLASVLAINLLAGISFSYEIPNEGNEVIVLVDVTDSNTSTREQKDEFIQTVLGLCEEDCKVGIVKFGFDQKYAAPLSRDTQEVMEQYLTSEDPDVTATNLADALKYASGLFTNPQSAKIVVLSDGVETDKNAVSVIKAIAAEGIKVDTLCFPNPVNNEIQIVGVNMPEQHLEPDKPFMMEVTLRHNLGKGEHSVGLTLFGNGEKVGATSFTMTKEEQTFPVALSLAGAGVNEISFEITLDKDTVAQNNFFMTYIHLQVFDRVLLIERKEGESQKLQELLDDEFQVTALSIEQDMTEIPKDLKTMAGYEQVILVNIAYSDMPAGFEELLNRYVYDLGGGLFTVGGENDMINGQLVPHAYNRTDIAQSTYYKQMLPVNVVDFTPPLALMIVVDASASMSQGKLPAAKEGAISCLDALKDGDFCGVVSFQNVSEENLQVLPASRRDEIKEAIDGIANDTGASGGTVFANAIERAGLALSVINSVERKHIILVTDGNPGDFPEQYMPKVEENVKNGITMSIVTIGQGDNSLVEKMTELATAGGGKFYNVPVNDMESVPSIMQQDLEMEAIPEIKYGEEFVPYIRDMSDVVAGIKQEDMPALTGYYGTVLKQDAIAPLMGAYVPIYAQWKYGNGNVGSFMCDLNGNWSGAFMDSDVGKTIIGNIVRNLFPLSALRADDLEYAFKTDNYTTQLNVHGAAETDRIQVQVAPLSKELASQMPDGIAVTPAEDNRRFTFVIKDPGLYRVTIIQQDEAGNEITKVVTYRAFSYSQEYNAFPDRQPLGEELMALLATDGKGVVLSDPTEVYQSFEKTIKLTHDPRIWFLIIVIVAVLLDIAVRKFKFKWPHELIREHKLKKADQIRKAD